MRERTLIACPLSIERVLVGPRRARTVRTGIGARRAERAAARLAGEPGALAVMGFCGALANGLRAGDVVVASEVRGPSGPPTPTTAPQRLAAQLRRAGLRVHVGPILSSERIVTGSERSRLAASGAIAVDTESAWLAGGGAGRPLAVVRVVVDTPERELRRALATLGGGLRAARALRAAAPAVQAWGASCGGRRLLLASPRASCAGVQRAVDMVLAALEARGAPLYVRRQIVHNAHVVADLERRGVRFVQELSEVPDGASVVLSAHGVSPAVRAEGRARGLDVIDATCPLVSKVHGEARRAAARGDTVILIGHAEHEEVEGVVGEAPGQTVVVADREEAGAVEVPDPGRVSYLTQTTLAVHETRAVVDVLRERFPALSPPPSQDICYATQNRQDAVREIAAECERVIVVGSPNSSNSRRLVEVAERAGASACLVDDESAIDLHWLAGATVVGVTAGASAPEDLVQRMLVALGELGPLSIEERSVTREDVHFRLAAGLQRRS